MRLFSSSTPSLSAARMVTKPVQKRHPMELPAYARMELIPGHDQAAYERAKIIGIGAGGLGSEVYHGAVRKGIGALDIYDMDAVDLSNLARQKFYGRDLAKNKAQRLVHNLSPEATRKTVLTGYSMTFQDAQQMGINLDGDVICCLVDSDETRVDVARHYLSKRPVVFAGTGFNADAAYVFVQEPGKACFVCMFPDALNSKGGGACAPSEIGLVKMISGFALFAIDTLLMPRKRFWNYRAMSLSGRFEEQMYIVERRPDCELCGGM